MEKKKNTPKLKINIEKKQIAIDELSFDQSKILKTDQQEKKIDKKLINQKMDSIAEFFFGERKKVNIWTYLFKELQQSLDRILRMCEIESKIAFCKGVRETLKYGFKALDKIEQKIKVDQQPNNYNQNLAWEVPFTNSKNLEDIMKETGFQDGYQENMNQDGKIEFKILNELVSEGKLNFLDAIVLIIRERAGLFSEAQEKKELTNSGIADDNKKNYQRAISQPQSNITLMNRVNLKVKFTDISNEDIDENKIQQLQSRMSEKQNLAQERRNILLEKQKYDIQKLHSKISEVQDKRNHLVKKRYEQILKKDNLKKLKQFQRLEEIKIQAQKNKLKPSEVTFLMLLDKQIKSKHIDPKLEETRKKRIKILDDFKLKKTSSRRQKSSELNKREKLEQQRKEKIKQKILEIKQVKEQHDQQQLKSKQKFQKQKSFEEERSKSLSRMRRSREEIYILLDLIQQKKIFEKTFKIIKTRNLKIKKIQDTEFKSNSFCLGQNNIKLLIEKQTKEENQLNQKQENGSSKKQQKKKNKRKRLKEENDMNEGKMKLSKFYNYITKDLDYLEQRKKNKKRQKNSALQMIKSQNLVGQEILELPELISREVGLKEKKSLRKGKFNFCTFCKVVIELDDIEIHLSSKGHFKKIKNISQQTLSEQNNGIRIMDENEVITQKFYVLKKKCKKIKHHIELASLKHDIFNKNEYYSSENKVRLTKLTLKLEKLISQQQKDYESIDYIFEEVHKIINKHQEVDLHILRINRFINVYIELIKSSHFCAKIDLPNFIKILNKHFEIFAKFCLLKKNRDYMYQTNKIIPIIELLSWSWSHSPHSLSCLDYVPQLLHLISFLFKHKLDDQFKDLKNNLIEYTYCSGILRRIKLKFTTFKIDIDIQQQSAFLSLVILKTLNFLETITSLCQQKNFINQQKLLIKETEVAGSLHLLATVLLSSGQFGRIQKQLPSICLTYSYFVLRIFNNFARTHLKKMQRMFQENSFNADQFYHIAVFLLDYCINNIGQKQIIFDTLYELILFIGYFSLENEQNKNHLSRGTQKHSIVQKIASLPSNQFLKNPLLRELVFPTLISLSYQHKTNMNILLDIIPKNHFIYYLKNKIDQYQKIQISPKVKDTQVQNLRYQISQCQFYNPNTVSVRQLFIMNRFPAEKLHSALDFIERINQFQFLDFIQQWNKMVQFQMLLYYVI